MKAVLSAVLALVGALSVQQAKADDFNVEMNDSSYAGYNDVCFYTGAYYTGQVFCIQPGQAVLNLGGSAFNDRIVSIRAPFARVQVCIDRDFRGGCEYFRGDIPDLSQYGWANTISSLRVESDWGPGPSPGPGPGPVPRPNPRPEPIPRPGPRPGPSDSVCFYQDDNFQGPSVCLSRGQEIQNLRDYGFNDRISSIWIAGWADVTFCSDAYFGGGCARTNQSLPSLSPHGWNDVISSIRVQ